MSDIDPLKRRRAVQAMKAKADAELERKQKWAAFTRIQNVQAAKGRAMSDHVLRSLEDRSAPSISSFLKRPGEKLATGKTRGMKKKSRGPGGRSV